MKAKSSELGKRGSLVKHVQVSDGELLVDSLSHFEGGLVFFAGAVVGTELDGAGTGLGLDGELNELRVSLDSESLV